MNFDQLPKLYENAPAPTLPVNAGGVLATDLVRTRLEDEEPDGGEIRIRLATMEDDWEFIESLQKDIRKQVGWWTPKMVEGYIAKDGVLIAERGMQPPRHRGTERGENSDKTDSLHSKSSSESQRLCGSSGVEKPPEKLGFVLFADTYRRQENLGVIYHINVKPMKQRKLIGAKLVQEAFERMPYGVRLCCCWCAQDMAANYFWESIGFVPLAFRTGSRTPGPSGKERIHIFWQRRIRDGHAPGAPGVSSGVSSGGRAGGTPYWYPYNTTGGQLSEQRLVLPLPPGTRWQDAKPVVLPEVRDQKSEINEEQGQLTSDLRPLTSSSPTSDLCPLTSDAPATLAELRALEAARVEQEYETKKITRRAAVVRGGRVRHEMIEANVIVAPAKKTPAKKTPAKKTRAKRKKIRPVKGTHPREHVKMSRELRDRYLEEVNLHAAELPPAACGKWNISCGGREEHLRITRAEDGTEIVDLPQSAKPPDSPEQQAKYRLAG